MGRQREPVKTEHDERGTGDGPGGAQFVAVHDAELRRYIVQRRDAADVPKLELGEKPAKPDGKHRLVGLALSGGGIRSATFSLGLVQALAKAGILKWCDYLSTVSGGGYFGACLSSLLTEAGVAYKDFPFRFDGQNEREEVRHLRDYSNYLAPRNEVWQIVSSYLAGVIMSLVTVLNMLGALSAVTIMAYPHLVRSVGEVLVLEAVLREPDRLWTHPHEWWVALFAPACAALVTWMVIGFLYLCLPRLSLPSRRSIGRAAARALMLGVVLAAAGGLPFLFHWVGGFTVEKLGALGLTLGVLAPAVLKLPAAAEEGTKLARPYRRMLLLAAAVAFLLLLSFAVLFAVWSLNLHHEHRFFLPFVFGSCTFTLVVLGFFVDINRMSMFHFYRDRLSEAYCFKRSQEGMVSNDRLTLSELTDPSDSGAPYLLVNTAVNLPGSRSLRLRGRKADFFLLSPLFCGSRATGYVETQDVDCPCDTLASAMATSGAALNPQWGARTNVPVAMLMALFNLRLGLWVRNPRYVGQRRHQLMSAFRFWPYYLLASPDERSYLLNLSDGGHIENLGIYELLRRRCSVIIASDATADPSRSFDDLGGLIRKARIDLGVEIVIDISKLEPHEDTGLSSVHAVVGEIHYPPQPTGEGDARADPTDGVGRLIFVKSSLVASDTEDLLQYHRANPSFPHESTADQFFDEAQFESYRELGYRSGTEAASLWVPPVETAPPD